MMTCRLLCALLVLALCCCPSVCVTENEVNGAPSAVPSVPKVPEVQEPVEKEVEQSERVDKPVIAAGTEYTQEMVSGGSSNSQGAPGVSGQSTLQIPGVPLRPHTVPTVASGEQSGPIQSGKEEEKKMTASTTTTTTTTKAPTMTTTTTTTTTKAPTTTTTRAPSRLREIDGSLSSSAWVCAPLLLAVSAMVYTTVG
ncbi:putative mucin TcMUCII [Trypanosoma cruzi]|uniref:Mucin TcMUCII, putative n=2 Tax=Trypanosoma cruzi TaxID=5693 RepID=Q4E3E9_TRYCC|nr:mucin TcMUCII, putative [Trypanosoma cruzi]EAN99285.1 mucin TcMUCII, putative [Trypanosoma cruzi]PWV20783.1 putative mucin TcMUCII [Trypanosoma cruzi]RNC48046.1 mucin TcMUCII [Trypanosoma cruzi]|eukprot:XP_821136.1 mucin TcMUCII [Trypanosoma cruzi strain CL Brener]